MFVNCNLLLIGGSVGLGCAQHSETSHITPPFMSPSGSGPTPFLHQGGSRPRLVVRALHALSFNKNTAVENVKGVATRPLCWHRCASAASWSPQRKCLSLTISLRESLGRAVTKVVVCRRRKSCKKSLKWSSISEKSSLFAVQFTGGDSFLRQTSVI